MKKKILFYACAFIGMLSVLPVMGRTFFFVSDTVLAVCSVIILFCLSVVFYLICDKYVNQ